MQLVRGQFTIEIFLVYMNLEYFSFFLLCCVVLCCLLSFLLSFCHWVFHWFLDWKFRVKIFNSNSNTITTRQAGNGMVVKVGGWVGGWVVLADSGSNGGERGKYRTQTIPNWFANWRCCHCHTFIALKHHISITLCYFLWFYAIFQVVTVGWTSSEDLDGELQWFWTTSSLLQ